MKSFSVEELNEKVGGVLIGKTSELITSPEQIENAQKGNITFIGNKNYIPLWLKSSATAALIDEKINILPSENRALIQVKNVDVAMAKILELFIPNQPKLESPIHKTAIIHDSVSIGNNCKIGANCYIGANVILGDNVTIYPNVSIFDDAVLGTGTIIWSGTVIRERCVVGKYCIIHPNVTIGSDGFGYCPSEDGRSIIKIPHIGNVIIGNGVEIGASTCIDRGKFSATTIGDGTKIDNLCQIAHNCRIGRMCLIAAGCGISGSVTVGDGVVMAGHVGIRDHITVGHRVKIGARSAVLNNIQDGETVLGYPAINYRDELKQWSMIKKIGKDGKL